MSVPPPAERLTAVLRAAQYLSNLSPEQDPWTELAHAMSSFFGCDLMLVVEADDRREPQLVHDPLARGILAADVVRMAKDEIRAVAETGFLGSQILTAPAYSLALLPLPHDRRTGAVAIVGRPGTEPFSKEELEILLALGGLFANVVSRVETERQLRERRQSLEDLVAERTAELAKANRQLAQESEVRRRAEIALEQAHAELEQIFETAADGLWVLDCQRKILRINATHARRLGRSPAELVGRACRDVCSCCDCDSRDCPLARILDGANRVESEMTHHYAEGEREDLVISTPFRSKGGALLGVVQVFHDITERKRAEQALRESERRLRETDQRKDEFLAVLSHELRNPLAPIKNSLYVFDHAAAGGEQAERAKAVINRQVDQLTRLIDDLLDVTRIASNKVRLQCQRVDLNALLLVALDDQRSLFEENGIELRLEPAAGALYVNADSARLSQVVGNLLQNAAKFTPAGGRTSLSACADPLGKKAVIRVADTGVGMAAETLAHLFEPFVQADKTLARSKGGLGLGLALVKGLVTLHGGDVCARSDGVGHGAEFIVSLPLDADRGTEATPIVHRAPEQHRRRVLIIEDNFDAADSLREVLELSEHEVAVAYNGPQGIAKAREFKPHVVLCDIGLPGMSGYEVAKAFRADDSLKGAFLVALSGYALPEDRKRAADAGFEQHLAKPPSLERLEQILAHLRS